MDRRVLPLFPLANVVLFPGCVVPLHVFEPRYRQLTATALAGDRIIGMATVRPEGIDDMAGDPPLYQVGCAGFVNEHQKLADGRYNLVLHGTARFRILRDMPPEGERLYRLAEVEPLEDGPGAREERSAALRAAVLERLREVIRRSGDAQSGSELPLEQLEQLDHATFANCVCHALGLPAAEKQGLLEAPDIAERLVRLEGLLAFHLAALGSTPAGGSQSFH